MAYVKLNESDATAIANAVRTKTGSSDTLTAPQTAAAILALETVDDVTVINCGTSTTVNT